jgi:3-oxoacyl-[acyl-carrier-protein] synthase III
MVAALIHGGLGLSPAMAFLITGAFVVAFVVALQFAGALVLGGLTGTILG